MRQQSVPQSEGPRKDRRAGSAARDVIAQRWFRIGLLVLVALALVSGVYGGARAYNAAQAARDGKTALLRARTEIGRRDLPAARQALRDARTAFVRADEQLSGIGPLLVVGRLVPVVRVQVRGVEAFTEAGVRLSAAGLDLADSAEAVLEPEDGRVPASEAIGTLRKVDVALQRGAKTLFEAIEMVRELDGKRLIGPLGRARSELVAVLPEISTQATNAREGVRALVAFAGGAGPRRYLFLSQNPAEPRPTGGFIGTYGVITVFEGRIDIARYDSIESWTRTHPAARIPGIQASAPFRYLDPPMDQTLGNVNAVPDWPQVGRAAMDLWARGDEEPVDGVISLTPGALRRLLEVTGPVDVQAYGETVSASSLVERLDYHTHGPGAAAAAARGADRKDFVGALAEVVLRRVLTLPVDRWEPLAGAMVDSFDAREVLGYFTDPAVQETLVRRGWDGTLPAVGGDFFYEADFAFATKSGSGFRRTFEHTVEIGRDGSARVETSVTIQNARPADDVGLTYITLYGPHGAVVDTSLDEDPVSIEPEMSGHPGAAFFRDAPPGAAAQKLTVAWNVPDMLTKLPDGKLAYHLWWMRVPDHEGDVVRLSYRLPRGWRWKGGAPPAEFALTRDLVGTWLIEPD